MAETEIDVPRIRNNKIPTQIQFSGYEHETTKTL